ARVHSTPLMVPQSKRIPLMCSVCRFSIHSRRPLISISIAPMIPTISHRPFCMSFLLSLGLWGGEGNFKLIAVSSGGIGNPQAAAVGAIPGAAAGQALVKGRDRFICPAESFNEHIPGLEE